jgi:hypothetical protein
MGMIIQIDQIPLKVTCLRDRLLDGQVHTVVYQVDILHPSLPRTQASIHHPHPMFLK